jgi:hypothetical protein
VLSQSQQLVEEDKITMQNPEIKKEISRNSLSNIKIIEAKLNDLKSRLEKGEILEADEISILNQAMALMIPIGAAW